MFSHICESNSESPRREFLNFFNEFDDPDDEEYSISQCKQAKSQISKQKQLKKEPFKKNSFIDEIIKDLKNRSAVEQKNSHNEKDQEELIRQLLSLEQQMEISQQQRKTMKQRVKKNREILEDITEKWNDMKEIISDQNSYIYKLEQTMRMLNNGFDDFELALQNIGDILLGKTNLSVSVDNLSSDEIILQNDTSLSFNNIEQQILRSPQILKQIEYQYSDAEKKQDMPSGQVCQIVTSNRFIKEQRSEKQRYNRGPWSKEELQNYVDFILQNENKSEDDDFFSKLSNAIKSRNQTQCRVFHKLFRKKQKYE